MIGLIMAAALALPAGVTQDWYGNIADRRPAHVHSAVEDALWDVGPRPDHYCVYGPGQISDCNFQKFTLTELAEVHRLIALAPGCITWHVSYDVFDILTDIAIPSCRHKP